MTFDRSGELRAALRFAGWDAATLWLAAVALGGRLSHDDIAAAVDGSLPPADGDYEVLAAALNEHFFDAGLDHPVTATVARSATD
jgi:hypothetical protein